jgi:predicted AAA+ superfamily ATPase
MAECNPWWQSNLLPPGKPKERFPFHEISRLLSRPDLQRAIFLKGMRGVGKTTLLHQLARRFLSAKGTKPQQIVFLTFQNRGLRYVSWKDWFPLWEQHYRLNEGPVYFFLDEIQYCEGWSVGITSLLTNPRYRIVATGSSSTEILSELQSEVRRWIQVFVPTLSFYEYLYLFRPDVHEQIESANPQAVSAGLLKTLGDRTIFSRLLTFLDRLEQPFQDYLMRGGLPEMASPDDDLAAAQRLMNEDIDTALYQDMRSEFRGLDLKNLESLLLYIADNPGCLLDIQAAAGRLGASRPTVSKYVRALENACFIYSLRNTRASGKAALKGHRKVYGIDVSLRNALRRRDAGVLTNSAEAGGLLEMAVASHLKMAALRHGWELGYWRRGDQEEIDFVLPAGSEGLLLVEAKHGGDATRLRKALRHFPLQKQIRSLLLVTRHKSETGQTRLSEFPAIQTPLIKIPISIFLYVIGKSLSA